MEIKLIGHNSLYQVEQLQQALFGVDAPGCAESEVTTQNGEVCCTTAITIGEKTTRAKRSVLGDGSDIRALHRLVRQCFYDAALPHLPEEPAWGALSGVRPTKLSTKHCIEGGTEESADRLLREEYYVTDARRELALECTRSSLQALEKSQKGDVSLYIGIPFCPTRCSYCSFISRTVGKKQAPLTLYLQHLFQEIRQTGKLLREAGRTVRTVYVGGGTPTTLSAQQLEALLCEIKNHIDLQRCVEFTVEAGRPDTLTEEKLKVLRNWDVDRISINPQTMIDGVLAACGRPHTAGDVRQMYEKATEMGFADINMDLIAGLPENSFDGFRESLDALLALRPSNITVHTLALKKGADLFENRQKLPSGEEVSRMLDYSREALQAAGYRPYYLYRQKYMSGNFENIGWSRDNRDCLYNIYMMEELHPIVSLGGGAVSKINLGDSKLERFHNPKFPEQYIQQFPKVLEQKAAICTLLKQTQ